MNTFEEAVGQSSILVLGDNFPLFRGKKVFKYSDRNTEEKLQPDVLQGMSTSEEAVV